MHCGSSLSKMNALLESMIGLFASKFEDLPFLLRFLQQATRVLGKDDQEV